MSSLYSTKALGRDWMPTPVLGRSRGRFDSWPLEPVKARIASPTSRAMSALQIRGRLWERALISALIIFVMYYMLGQRSTASVATLRNPASGFLSGWREGSRKIELVDSITWDDFAYSTYATVTDYLCNSVMMMESLFRVGAKADRLILYNDRWDVEDANSTEARLLRQARDRYGVKVQPVRIIEPHDVTDPTWAEGFTKWWAFNQTHYRRLLHIDSDGTILRPMDELFLMPSAPVAIPRAYWLEDTLCSALTLVQPSTANFQAVQQQIRVRKAGDFDMEIINSVYGASCAVIPHRPYLVLSGEFRGEDHVKYLGSSTEKWDAEAVIQEAKYVHFSDWPLPKPWVPHTRKQWDEAKPKCADGGYCDELRIWTTLYEDFWERRADVCGPEFKKWAEREDFSHDAPSSTSVEDLAMAVGLGTPPKEFVAPEATPTDSVEVVETVVNVVVVDENGNVLPDDVAKEEIEKLNMAQRGIESAEPNAEEG